MLSLNDCPDTVCCAGCAADDELQCLIAHWKAIGPRARKILLLNAARLEEGAIQYGDDFSRGRPYGKMALEEIVDCMQYVGNMILELEEGGALKP
jgi:hypothetical protein